VVIAEENDHLFRFIFEKMGVRGEIVSLDASWQAALAVHDYPDVVAGQLGQALSASLLLSATLKFKGSLILQAQGDGPISMLVAQATDQQTVRGLAHWKGDIEPGNLQSLFGEGRLVLTIKSEQGMPYQGIVALEGDSLAEALQCYFEQSEQLKTRIWFAVDGQRAVGFLLQELPAQKGADEDWSRIEMLANTITQEELLALPAAEVIHRLFHEEAVRLYEPEPVSFRCSCSREKVASSLISLGREELLSILQEKELIEADCDFCNHHYQFDAIDVEQLFIDGVVSEPASNQ
jgi:molecular chaperone Hsp33